MGDETGNGGGGGAGGQPPAHLTGEFDDPSEAELWLLCCVALGKKSVYDENRFAEKQRTIRGSLLRAIADGYLFPYEVHRRIREKYPEFAGAWLHPEPNSPPSEERKLASDERKPVANGSPSFYLHNINFDGPISLNACRIGNLELNQCDVSFVDLSDSIIDRVRIEGLHNCEAVFAINTTVRTCLTLIDNPRLGMIYLTQSMCETLEFDAAGFGDHKSHVVLAGLRYRSIAYRNNPPQTILRDLLKRSQAGKSANAHGSVRNDLKEGVGSTEAGSNQSSSRKTTQPTPRGPDDPAETQVAETRSAEKQATKQDNRDVVSPNHLALRVSNGHILVLTQEEIATLQAEKQRRKSDQDSKGRKKNGPLDFVANRLNNLFNSLNKIFSGPVAEEGSSSTLQPYSQAARILRSMGYHDKADDILFARGKQENALRGDRCFTVKELLKLLLAPVGVAVYVLSLSMDTEVEIAALFVAAVVVLYALYRPLVWMLYVLFGLFLGFGVRATRSLIVISGLILAGTVGVEHLVSNKRLIIDQQPVSSYIEMEKDELGVMVLEPAIGQEADRKTVLLARIPCEDSITPFLYALDVFLPIIDLREEAKCEIGLPWTETSTSTVEAEIQWWKHAKSVYALLGWLMVSLAILTFSGVFKRRLEEG